MDKYSLRLAKKELQTIEGASRKLAEHLSKILKNYSRVGLYAAFGYEVRIDKVLTMLPGKNFALPKMVEGEMQMCQYLPFENLQRSQMGFLEPISSKAIIPDAVVAPGLNFDLQGHRLGRGGGHYDRYFAKYPLIARIGACSHHELLASIPTEAHDIKMHYIATESIILRF